MRPPSRIPRPTLSVRITDSDARTLLGGAGVSLFQRWRDAGARRVYWPASVAPENLTACSALADDGFRVVGRLDAHSGAPPGEGSSGLPCLTRPDARRAMTEAIAHAARAFEEVIVERPPLSDCRCADCRRAKGKRPWGEFRASAARQAAQEWIAAARAARPDARISLILPANGDAPEAAGIPLLSLAPLFDGLLMGDSEAAPSPVWFRWLAEIVGRKARGALLPLTDPLNAALSMTLAGAAELVVPADLAASPDAEPLSRLAERMESLQHLAQLARVTPRRGAALYLPAQSGFWSEAFSLDALEATGLPLRPTPRFPSSSNVALFTRYAAADRDLLPKLQALRESGATLAVTRALLETLAERGTPLPRDGLLFWPDDSRDIAAARDLLLRPLGLNYDGPVGVTLSLFGFRDLVLNQTGDRPGPIHVELPGKRLMVAASSDAALEPGAAFPPGSRLAAGAWVHLRA